VNRECFMKNKSKTKLPIGTWMKADIHKGRSRDTAWFSIVDEEWPQVKQEFQRWFNPEKFRNKWAATTD
ncbi:unnamed protein product, partial [Rotaria magnacalcarata]